jgi:hypothetical protein
MQGGALRTSVPSGAFGGDVAEAIGGLGREAQQAGNMLAQRAEQLQAIDNKIAVDDASLRVQQRQQQYLLDYTTKNQGERAEPNLPQAFKDLEGIRNEEGANLLSPDARNMYNSATRIATFQANSRLASFASSEGLRTRNDKIDATITNTMQAATPETFNQVAATLGAQVGLKTRLNGWSGEQGKALLDEKLSSTVYNTVISMIAENPMGAQEFLNSHSDLLNLQQKAQAQAQVKARVEPVAIAQDVDDIIARNAVQAATGQATDASSYREAISGIESGGRYNAQGPTTKSGDRAYGKYQVMGANIPAWTKEVLGKSMTPAQFLASPQAQDAVFDAKFGQSIAKYGNAEDAASVWFTGRPRAQGAGAKDVLGTSGADYVQKFAAATSRTALVEQSGTGGSQVDLMESRVPQMLAELRANPRYANRPDLLDAAEARLMSNIGRLRSANNIANGEALGRLQLAALEGGVQDLATLQTAYPGALQDYTQLSAQGKRQLQVGLLQEANRWTPLRGARTNELIGMAGDKPADFLKVDLSGEDITRNDRESLLKKQVAIRNKDKTQAAKSASFKKMMGSPWVQAQVKGLGLTPASGGYWYFSGALEAQFDQWTANNPGKGPTDKDISTMVGAITTKAYEWKNGKVGGELQRRENAEGGDALRFEPSETDASSAETYLRAKGLAVNQQSISYYLTLVRDLRAAANKRGVQVSPDQFDAFIMENLGG